MRFCLALIIFALATGSVVAQSVDYLKEVKPLLVSRCGSCHGALTQKSKLRVDTAAFIKKGGRNGPAIVPGKSDESLLIDAVLGRNHTRMPPQKEGPPLTTAQVAILNKWIDAGAPAPKDEPIPADPRSHWAFQKPVRQAIPKTTDEAWGRNPIDSFVAAQHAKYGLAPLPIADKATLLRRVTLDLTGLPPTREQLHAFLADMSADAYEKAVDRLLASPQHGERWARHWMDVWRYSDWYGRRQEKDWRNSSPTQWHWRDWIVNSLNAHKGYDRMVQEMLAADEIAPEDDGAQAATGFLVRNYYSLNHDTWMKDQVEHTAKAFLGLTLNCCHCHDHKYDPISQEEYFRFRAFFEPLGLRQDRVPGEPDPGPFQKYNYSGFGKVIASGLVRAMDERLDAKTRMYRLGNDRDFLPDRPAVTPGAPAIVGGDKITITAVMLPPRAYYPGLKTFIQQEETVKARGNVASREQDLAKAKLAFAMNSVPLTKAVAEAEEVLALAMTKAGPAASNAINGTLSLVLDSQDGRKALFHPLTGLQRIDNQTVIDFKVRILKEGHLNFQLIKDLGKGETASFIAFEKGKIICYQPGGFREFQVGTYDFLKGQNQFAVGLELNIEKDSALLFVRSMTDKAVLVNGTVVAINGWNPTKKSNQGIVLDVRPHTAAAFDDILIGQKGNVPQFRFDFEGGRHRDSHDVAGIDGWTDTSSSSAAATAKTSRLANVPIIVKQAEENLFRSRRKLEAAQLAVAVAEMELASAKAAMASIEGRITADQTAYFGDKADAEKLARTAIQREREASLSARRLGVCTAQHALATAEGKPANDAKRTAEIQAAVKQLSTARAALDAEAAATPRSTYTPLSPTYGSKSSGRRKSLALWMASKDNPLTARVAVNHIWMRHFGEPLVKSVFDFGINGKAPTHPELLDWLAVEFMESNWSLKHLHKLIVTSRTYQSRSSMALDNPNLAKDADNRWLWRFTSRRLEAEVVRDAMLFATGDLDTKLGGKEIEPAEEKKSRRRSLYFTCHPETGGSLKLLEFFDAPDPCDCYRRAESLVPQQALALTNSEFALERSRSLATRWLADAKGDDAGAMITKAFEEVLTRRPTKEELVACMDFLKVQTSLVAKTARSPDDARRRAWESLARVLFSHHEFITLR